MRSAGTVRHEHDGIAAKRRSPLRNRGEASAPLFDSTTPDVLS
ncbi:hypothetical protein ACVIIV_000337 [Bradyrhizobium sp. USDA 4354]